MLVRSVLDALSSGPGIRRLLPRLMLRTLSLLDVAATLDPGSVMSPRQRGPVVSTVVRWAGRLVTAAVVSLALAAPAAGQAAQGASGGVHGNFFFSVGRSSPDSPGRPPFDGSTRTSLVSIGGGGEAALGRVFGVGTEFGGILHVNYIGSAEFVAADGFYHPFGQHRRFDPYGAVGISSVSSPSGPHAARANGGVGLNWWLPPRRHHLGIGIEVRRVSAGSHGSGFRETRVLLRLWQ